MEAFKHKDKSYELSLTIGKARKCGKLFDFDVLESDPGKLAADVVVRPTLQIDLIWHMLDDKPTEFEGYESPQDLFECTVLDGGAFEDARSAMYAELTNFIRSTRPHLEELLTEAIQLTTTQITQSAIDAVSLFKSPEVQKGFSHASADAVEKAKKLIGNEFARLAEQSPETLTQ